MKKRKHVVWQVALLVLATFLAGCSKTDSSGEEVSADDPLEVIIEKAQKEGRIDSVSMPRIQMRLN